MEERILKEGEPERLVCRNCGFVFYLGPKLVAGALFEADGGMLLVQRDIEPGYGKWTFPGGFVERGEKAETAAEREVLEETGLEITGLRHRRALLIRRTNAGYCRFRSACGWRGTEAAGRNDGRARRTHGMGSPGHDLAFPSTEHALKDYLSLTPPDGTIPKSERRNS